MRKPPPLTRFPKYPVVSLTLLLALAASLAYWSGKVNVEFLFETIDIRRGQLWRLLSSALPHGNILHLAFNLYWTWAFGSLVEERYGHLKTLAIFALFAFIPNAAEFTFLDGGIGLSGIGYGLFGLLLILHRRDPRFADALNPKTIQLFIGWFFFCIILTLAGTPIANIAHAAGALTGILLGFALAAQPHQRKPATAALALLFAATLLGATIARPFLNLSKYAGYEEARRGYQLLVADRNQQALPWLRDATRMNPTVPHFWFNLGIALERLDRRPEALAAYQRAHELQPTDPQYAIPASFVSLTTAPASQPTTTK